MTRKAKSFVQPGVPQSPAEVVTDGLATIRKYLQGAGATEALEHLSAVDAAAGGLIASGAAVANANANMANLYLEIEEAKDEAEERERGVRAAHRTIAQMLQCIQQGLLTLDEDLRIQPEYSAHLEDILATTDLAGKDFAQLVFARSGLATDAASMAAGALRMGFGHAAFLFELNVHALPVELVWETPAGARLTLELEYSVIANDEDCVARVMVCIRDVTEVRELRTQAEQADREMKIVAEILAHSERTFSRWHADTQASLGTLGGLSAAPSGGAPPEADEASLARARSTWLMELHTVKGNARLLGFGALCDAVHAAEESSLALLADAAPWPTQALEGVMTEVRQVFERYAATARGRLGRDLAVTANRPDGAAWAHIQSLASTAVRALDGRTGPALSTLFQAIDGVSVDTIADVVGRTALDDLAKRCGKPTPQIHVEGGEIALEPTLCTFVGGAFSHAISNAIDHGIEDADARVRAGKPAAGRIDVHARAVDGHLVLSITDDGAGVDLAALREKLCAAQESDTQNMSDHEVAETIFASGTSTATRVTQVSGRGVGMAWLKREAERLGGWARVQPLDEQPNVGRLLFRVEIGLPLDNAPELAVAQGA